MKRITFPQCRFRICNYKDFHDSYFGCESTLDVSAYCQHHASTCFSTSRRSFVDVPNLYRSAYRSAYRAVLLSMSYRPGVSLDSLSFVLFCLSNYLYIFVNDADGNIIYKYRHPHALCDKR